MAINQERLVTAAVVTSGETADGDYMQELIDKSRENGQEVDEAIGDGAYSSNENLEECERKGVKVIAKLNANVVQGCRKEDGGFSFNKDAGMYVCPAGHMAVRKAVAKARDNMAAREVHYFDTRKCVLCKWREGCFAFNQRTKSYSVSIHSEAQERQRAFQETDEFNNLGYDRAESYGIGCMALQGAVAIYASNLKRIVRMLGEKSGK